MNEKYELFILVCPNGKPASWLEDYKQFSEKERQGIFKHCSENIRKKSRPDEKFCYFLSFSTKVTVLAVVTRFVYGLFH